MYYFWLGREADECVPLTVVELQAARARAYLTWYILYYGRTPS
jgi:hypothetical protein